jgi:hypothetical protein
MGRFLIAFVPYTLTKKITNFPIFSRNVTYQTPPGREKLNYYRPGGFWLVTFRLVTRQPRTFLKSVSSSSIFYFEVKLQMHLFRATWPLIHKLYRKENILEESHASSADVFLGSAHPPPSHTLQINLNLCIPSKRIACVLSPNFNIPPNREIYK